MDEHITEALPRIDLVMVGFLLVAVVGAIVADLGRFYVVTGELRTGADAAAEGTIVGYRHSLSSTTITPDDVLNDPVSNVQRLILVN